MKPPDLRPVPDESALASKAAAFIAAVIRAAIRENGRCVLGLCGGTTVGGAYERLGEAGNIEWDKVWIFLTDDRHVRADSPKSNQFLLRNTLLKHAPVPESQVIVPDAALAPGEAARLYGQVLLALSKKSPPDLIVLGMGEDGHIGSLFPPLDDHAVSDTGAVHTVTDRFDIPHRISATLPLLASARQAVMLLKGPEKKRVWEEMSGAKHDPARWPLHAVLAVMPVTVFAAP